MYSVPCHVLVIKRKTFGRVAVLLFALQCFEGTWCLKNGCKINQWKIDDFQFKTGQIHILNVNMGKLTTEMDSLNIFLSNTNYFTIGCGTPIFCLFCLIEVTLLKKKK